MTIQDNGDNAAEWEAHTQEQVACATAALLLLGFDYTVEFCYPHRWLIRVLEIDYMTRLKLAPYHLDPLVYARSKGDI